MSERIKMACRAFCEWFIFPTLPGDAIVRAAQDARDAEARFWTNPSHRLKADGIKARAHD